jgi:hypothetical protein
MRWFSISTCPRSITGRAWVIGSTTPFWTANQAIRGLPSQLSSTIIGFDNGMQISWHWVPPCDTGRDVARRIMNESAALLRITSKLSWRSEIDCMEFLHVIVFSQTPYQGKVIS